MTRTTEPRMASLDAEPTTHRLSPSLDGVVYDGKYVGTIREFAGVSIAKAEEPYSRTAYTFGSTSREEALDALIHYVINLSPRDFSNLPNACALYAVL